MLSFPHRVVQSFLISFQKREICSYLNIDVTKSILLYGPSGTGKSFVVQNLSSKYKAKLFTVTIGILAVEFPAEPEKGLRHYFNLAYKNQPSVLLLENIELLFPLDGEPLLSFYFHELFNAWIDNEQRVLVIGTTTNNSQINPIIRTIFQDEIEFNIPTPIQRLEILKYCLKDLDLERDLSLKEINDKCHGYIAADIATLCRLALEQCNIRSQQTGEPGNLLISSEDFQKSFQKIRISSLQKKASIQKIESVKWSDIGGLEEAKRTLEESVIWIYKHADAFQHLGIKLSKGVLLYGPPGTGKTLLAKAVATESSAHFMPISIPELIKSEVGESEKAIANVFQIAIQCSPCIIFLDELEAMFGNRESSGSLGKKLISQLLLELDGLNSADNVGVVILAATNNPKAIDLSLLRPGRLDRHVYIKPPTFKERVSILKVLGNIMKFSQEVNLEEIAQKTENYTGADLKALVQKSAFLAFKRYCQNKSSMEKNIYHNDMLEAIEKMNPSVSIYQLEQYQIFSESLM